MLQRSLTFAVRRSIGRGPRVTSLRPQALFISSISAYSTAQARVLLPSTFPARDDFSMTKLVHGSTDMKIGISKRASEKLTNIAMEDGNEKSAIRIKVESGGCHGFQYNIKLTDTDTELAEDDSLLVFKRTGDGGKEKATLIIDESSLQILQDSKLDYTKELIGSQFKIVDSPYTSSACGCGSSFDFDFDKLQEKLDSKQQ